MPHSKAQILDRSGFKAIVFTTQRAISKEAVVEAESAPILSQIKDVWDKNKSIFTPQRSSLVQVNQSDGKLGAILQSLQNIPPLLVQTSLKYHPLLKHLVLRQTF